MSMDRATPRGDRREDGYILVWCAMSLLTLLLIGALAVDVGMFYVRSNELERSADAAALAGVVFMPGNLAAATDAAHEVLQKNGFDPGDPDVDVVVEQGANPRRLRVTITDRRVETFLAKFVQDSISITRTSEAEYSVPLRMGSPDNYLGSGTLHPSFPGTKPADYAEEQGFWLAVNGFCTAAEDGDPRLSAYDGSRRKAPNAYHCDNVNGEVNPNYGEGYDYVVEVPETRTGMVNVDIFDPNYWPDDRPCGPSTSCDLYRYATQTSYRNTYQNRKAGADNRWLNRPIDQRADGSRVGTVTTYYQLFYPDMNDTPYDYSDDTAVSPPLVYSGGTDSPYTWPYDSGYLADFDAQRATFNEWVNGWQISTGMPAGAYRMRVWTEAAESGSFGINAFSLRAHYGTAARCDSRVVGQESCPQVSGLSGMSILGSVQNSTAVFKLAQIPQDFAGRTVQVRLWDPGEGGQQLTFHNPDRANDQEWPFAWREAPGPDAIYGWEGAYALDVSGCGSAWPQPGAAGTRFGDCRFNDRMVEVSIDIPVDYNASDDGWWSIRYDYGSGVSVTDRTTWTVDVVGDPVHLVEPSS